MHPFSNPLKTSENLKVFWCCQGVEKECIENQWVNEKTEKLVQNFMEIIFWHCRFVNPNSDPEDISYTRYLLVRKCCYSLFFGSSKKLAFEEHLFSRIRQKYLFRLHEVSPVKSNHSYNTYDFIKTAKIRETYDDFCDGERYPTVIWTNRHSASAFKKRLKFSHKNFLFRNETKTTCIVPSFIGSKNVPEL